MRLNMRVDVYRQFEKRDVPEGTVTFEGARVKKGTVLEVFHMSVVDVDEHKKEFRLGWQDVKDEYHWVEVCESAASHRQHGVHLSGHLHRPEYVRKILWREGQYRDLPGGLSEL